MNQVILCVLSPYNGRKVEVLAPDDKTYMGDQTNIAPLEYLLELRKNEGQASIICLCSKEVNGPKAEIGNLSTFDYVYDVIAEYCNEHSISVPVFTSLTYNPEKPSLSLIGAVSAIPNHARVDIDLTGGGRDAVVLFTLVSQILEERKNSAGPLSKLGNVVYSNILGGHNQLFCLDETFALTKLLRACDAFATYGKADQLYELFGNRTDISKETKAFVKDAQRFSDAIALNRVDDIIQLAGLVQDDLEAIDSKIGAYAKKFLSAQQDLEILEFSPDSLSTEEIIERENTCKKLRYSMDEILLSALVDNMREQFIPQANCDEEKIVEAIKWCTKHQLVMQALTMFVEQIPPILCKAGYIREKESVLDLKDSWRNKLKHACCKCFTIDMEDNRPVIKFLETYTLQFGPQKKDISPQEYLEPGCSKEEFHKIIAWYFYINFTRNQIIHADDNAPGKGNTKIKNVASFLGTQYDENLNLEKIASDIVKALDFIFNCTSGQKVDYTLAVKPTNKQATSGNKSGNRTELKPIESFEILMNYIEEYVASRSSEKGEMSIDLQNEFTRWLKKRGFAFSKATLGLGKSASLAERIVSHSNGRLQRVEGDSTRVIFVS